MSVGSLPVNVFVVNVFAVNVFVVNAIPRRIESAESHLTNSAPSVSPARQTDYTLMV